MKGKAAYRKWEECEKTGKKFTWKDSEYSKWTRKEDVEIPMKKPKSRQSGVNWDLEQEKWLVRVSVNGHQRFVGRYADEEDAIQAQLDFAKREGDLTNVDLSKAKGGKGGSKTKSGSKKRKRKGGGNPWSDDESSESSEEKSSEEEEEEDSSEEESDAAGGEEDDEEMDDSSSYESDGEGCQVCGDDQDDANILLCDGCPAEYHVYCLELETVPDGEWYCPSCVADRKHVGKGGGGGVGGAAAGAAPAAPLLWLSSPRKSKNSQPSVLLPGRDRHTEVSPGIAAEARRIELAIGYRPCCRCVLLSWVVALRSVAIPIAT